MPQHPAGPGRFSLLRWCQWGSQIIAAGCSQPSSGSGRVVGSGGGGGNTHRDVLAAGIACELGIILLVASGLRQGE